MDLTLGSGWPYGGPHIPIAEASGRLRGGSRALGGGGEVWPRAQAADGDS